MSSLTTRSWRRLQAIFAEASALPLSQRDAFLDRACAEDAALRSQILRMLEEHDHARGPLDQPLAAPPEGGGNGLLLEQAPLVGKQVGPFRVLRLIAAGGMGTVYEAQQDQPRRIVALKIMNAAIPSPDAVRRFRRESEVLGRLQHPGIAQVYEAGVFEGEGTSAPQPFFAMEMIRGCPVTEYAERRGLSVHERLHVLLQICHAVEYAHRQGVIHRDLKPANILATEDTADGPKPVCLPKIVDFGVARATAPDLSAATLRTDVGAIIGTVPYMSPEQLAGDPAKIDHRCDVYALGVIGYELLAGHPPFDVRARSLPEAMHIIEHNEPASLSRINRGLRGDLQTIIEHAMEKEPSRRYASAAALADDIRRHLEDQAITARPPSALYQLRKFARRNRMLVGGVAATMLALALGIVATSWQWSVAAAQRNRAARERDRAITVMGGMTQFTEDQLSGLPGGAKARLALAQQALNAMLAADVASDDSFQPSLAYARQRVGEALLAGGQTAASLAQFQQSLAIRQHIVEVQPDDLTARRQLAVGYWKVAEAEALVDRHDDALRDNRQSLALLQEIVRREDDAARRNDPTVIYLGPGFRRVADALAAGGDDAAAIEHYRESLRQFERFISLNPTSSTARRGRIMAQRGLAETLMRQQDQPVEATALLQETWRTLEALEREVRPANLWERSEQVRVQLAMAEIARSSNDGAAELTAAAEAKRVAMALTEADETDMAAGHLRAVSCLALAGAYRRAGDCAAARANLTQAVSDLQALIRLDPDRVAMQRDLARATTELRDLGGSETAPAAAADK